MLQTPRILAAVVLFTLCLASTALGMRKLGLEAGYIASSSDKYGSGLVYGATLMEAQGRLGFGLSVQHFGNAFSSSISRVNPQTGKPQAYDFIDHVHDAVLTILGIWVRPNRLEGGQWILGVGPEVHFLASNGEHAKNLSFSARDSRLGLGLLVRYERGIQMFGRTTLTATARLSWMQSGEEPADIFTYSPPPDGYTSGSLALGLAFPL